MKIEEAEQFFRDWVTGGSGKQECFPLNHAMLSALNELRRLRRKNKTLEKMLVKHMGGKKTLPKDANPAKNAERGKHARTKTRTI